jgi:hypothetical protein
MIWMIFIFVSQAFSQIPSGVWQGDGIYDAWGVGRYEAKATVNIQIENTSLSIKDCWKFMRNQQNWNLCYDHSFEIKGTDLFVNETKVGTIRDQEIEIIYKRDEGQIHAVLKWDQNAILSGFHNSISQSGRYTNKSSEKLEPQN